MQPTTPGYEIVDFAMVMGTDCPCGVSRRGFVDTPDAPASLHVTEISSEAALHYHRRLTELYYFLACEPDAAMQLNEETIPVHTGMAIMIRPGTRHRAVGRMQVLLLSIPRFDPQDEWFD